MDSMRPVTVCLPVYNAARYLRECIDSILAQDFTDFELLVADDGSEDESVEIVCSYADPRIRLVRGRHDYIASLNRMLDEAGGKYIARMDADDVMMPDRLSRQYEYMEAHPEVDVVGGAMTMYGNESDVIVPPRTERDLTLRDLAMGNYLGNPTTFLRTSTVKALRVRYEEAFKYAEDYRFWAQLLRGGAVVRCLKEPVIKYRLSKDQTTYKYPEYVSAAAEKNRNEITHWISDKYWEQYTPPCIAKGSNALTVIIPFLNEGEELVRTVRGIRESVGLSVDIIVINDQSTDDYPYCEELQPYGVYYVLNRDRQGVAASRDRGVALCETPYFLLLDGHMRFYDDRWAKRLESLLSENDRCLLCCQTKCLGKDENGQVRVLEECPPSYGACGTFRGDRLWPDMDWNYKEAYPQQRVEPIPYVLGAAYACSKQYWQRLGGLQGLRNYGSDEAFISLKVWREGGQCLLVKDITVGHIYRNSSPFQRFEDREVFNHILVSYLTFSQSWHCYALAVAKRQKPELFRKAMKSFELDREKIDEQKAYLDTIYAKSFEEVLLLHKEKLLAEGQFNAEKEQLGDIALFLEEHPVRASGLFDGQTGHFLWFALYAQLTREERWERRAEGLWQAIAEDIERRRLSWNFAQGLCGVGWTLIFLHARGVLRSYPRTILENIDAQLQEIAIENCPAADFGLGVSGLLAYAALRCKTGTPAWDGAFVEKLKTAALTVASASRDLPSIYYALFLEDILNHGARMEPYFPKISEWMTFAQHLPADKAYWKPTLFNGCIGASLIAMENLLSQREYA